MARQLHERGCDFVIVDNDPMRAMEAEEEEYFIVQGDATDESTLEDAGIAHANVLATVLPDDALNVFITLTAKGMNADLQVMARGEQPSTEKKLKQAGADRVVIPAAICAERMVEIIHD